MRPLHVTAGFLESDRGSRDSGVCGMKGIVNEMIQTWEGVFLLPKTMGRGSSAVNASWPVIHCRRVKRRLVLWLGS